MADVMPDLIETLRTEGFAFVHADAMRAALERHAALTDWESLAAS